jgi:hypothetical protein
MRPVLAAATLSTLAGLSGAVGAPAATGPSTVKITDVQLQLKEVDHGADGSSVGDLEVARLRLYNPSVTQRSIGRGDMLCTYLDRKSRSCTATYSLPRGKLMVSGVITTRLLYELAVIGGTGLYDNARGSLVATTTSFKPRKEVLVFRLSG